MIWISLLLGITFAFGGYCLCCGCRHCTDDPGDLQATLAGFTNDQCTGDDCCTALNGVLPLEGPTFEMIPTTAPTEPDGGFGVGTFCHWAGIIDDVICSTIECDACDGTSCEITFGDHDVHHPDLETCEETCAAGDREQDNISPGAGEHSLQYDNTECQDCSLTHAPTCAYDCAPTGPVPACACVSDGMGGYDCLCEGTCGCDSQCDTVPGGIVDVFIYPAGGDLIVYVRLRTFEAVMYHGEHVFSGVTEIECATEIGPLSVTIAHDGGDIPVCCGDPTMTIDLEFV